MSLASVVNESHMNAQAYVTIIAQTESGEIIKQGLEQSSKSTLGINPELGLVVLAEGTQEHDEGARKSVEILLDDMQLNLSSILHEPRSGAVASECLLESIENINDYLHSLTCQDSSTTTRTAVSIIASQFIQHKCSVMAVGEYHCLLLHQDNLQNLVLGASNNLLGEDNGIQALTAEPDIQQGDTLVLLPSSVVSAIGEEFIRVTLLRFADNLDMALRQINTRTARQGMATKPVIAICKILQSAGKQRSWLDKLRKR